MRKMIRRTALFAILALALPVVLPSVASAQMREFSGKIDKISGGKLIVDNRKGDKVSFVKVDETEVTGERTSWDDLKKDDWVTVSWKMIDKPRKAYKIQVLPPREEAGEDELFGAPAWRFDDGPPVSRGAVVRPGRTRVFGPISP